MDNAIKNEYIQSAIQLERDGRKFYTDLALKTENRYVGSALRALAEDETRHIEWLKDLGNKDLQVAAVNIELYNNVRGIFADSDGKFETAEADTDIIKHAIKMEIDSAKAYDDWHEKVNDLDAKELFKKIADVERFHVQLLENTLMYLDSTIDWFMQEEKWSFDGG